MSYIYSQALVAEYSQANCSDTDASAPLSGSPTPRPCLWHDKTMEPSSLSRFGMTCKPLTDDHGKALLTWWQGASRARTLALRGGGAGLDGKRSGMWHHMARIIGEVRPRLAYIENSPALVTRGLDRVLSDLAALGFDARWGVLSAADVGAPHKRERIWILANASGRRLCEPHSGQIQQPGRAETFCAGNESSLLANTIGQRFPAWRHDDRQHDRAQPGASGEYAELLADAASAGLPQRRCTGQPESPTQDGSGMVAQLERCGDVANASSERIERQQPCIADAQGWPRPQHRPAGPCSDEVRRWPTEPQLGRVANGVAHRAHRIRAIGNGQVSRVAATAFKLLSNT